MLVAPDVVGVADREDGGGGREGQGEAQLKQALLDSSTDDNDAANMGGPQPTSDEVLYNWSQFHMTFALASFYTTMVLTDWMFIHDGHDAGLMVCRGDTGQGGLMLGLHSPLHLDAGRAGLPPGPRLQLSPSCASPCGPTHSPTCLASQSLDRAGALLPNPILACDLVLLLWVTFWI